MRVASSLLATRVLYAGYLTRFVLWGALSIFECRRFKCIVSKNKQKPVQKANVKSPAPKPEANARPGVFTVTRPILWLALASIIVYLYSLSFGYTELDDSIFIKDFQAYNEDVHNLFASFGRGLFDAVKDPYYRPLFSDSMILNYQLSGTNIFGYHVVNILLHMTVVILLFKLLRKLEIKELAAFILALVFAVHPVLSQAVAWIPGRNDSMLAIFVISSMLFTIDYSNNGKIKDLALSATFLLLAFFTKETAVFAPPAAFILLVLVLNKNWPGKRNLLLYAKWAGCYLLWFLARNMATTASTGIASAQGLSEMIHRLPVVIQYLGKIFLPVNLSVFPTQQDTVYYYGIIAVAVLAIILFLNKQRNVKVILGGLGVFLLFLMPALLVPDRLNAQTFEHRLYLPIIGILLLLPQTILFTNKLTDKQMSGAGIAVCCILAAVNIDHQKSFADPKSFWAEAEETSPNSAYANMMLAARLDASEIPRSEALFRKAYALNPKEKYLNFYMGDMLQKKDSVQASEKYLLAEKSISDFYKCDFLLARVTMERKDFNGTEAYLLSYLKRDPRNSMANNNLILMYLQLQQPEKAKAHIRHMQQIGAEVPQALMHQAGM